MLPDRSILIGQKLMENAQLENSNETFSVICQQCAYTYSATLNSTSFPFQYGGPGRGINDMNGMDPNQPRVSTRSR